MKDIGTTLRLADPARDLVVRLVRRVQNDADLAYLIDPFTETGELLLRAAQHCLGLDKEKARAALEPRHDRLPRVVVLQDRVNALEALLDERCPGWRDTDGGAS